MKETSKESEQRRRFYASMDNDEMEELLERVSQEVKERRAEK